MMAGRVETNPARHHLHLSQAPDWHVFDPEQG